ncbi:MAG: thioredoxin domain-containing protein [Pseudomonadota bacterium]
MVENIPAPATNRLAAEKSPYLLQHAHNPVDWYPWGQEAFDESRRRDCPILVSIGYATCHWCHVMEKESFEDQSVADVMNRHFVSIKVDREERPDIDAVYMSAVSVLTGAGGWPLNVFLTPDRKPFFGGTYFPPATRHGIISWRDLLGRIAELWQSAHQRRRIDDSAERLTAALQQQATAPANSGAPSPALMATTAVAHLKKTFDGEWAGFGSAPKFPMPPLIDFLLAQPAADSEGPSARDMSLATLNAIASGGIHDHIGGGFHRYATDRQWHVPHFEKMLYDNAQLVAIYTRAFALTKDPRYRRVAEGTIGYVLRDLAHTDGGFYSAEDADSPPPEAPASSSLEGAFYIWTMDDIQRRLAPEEAAVFMNRYGVLPGGNVSADPHGDFTGKNILYTARTVASVAARQGIPVPVAATHLRNAREKLFQVRCNRPRPQLDDKILTEWNALMISALAQAAIHLNAPALHREAARGAGFLHRHLYDAGNRQLYRRWRQNDRQIPGMAADYAHLLNALLDLFSGSPEAAWLTWAVDLAEVLLSRFFDAEAGGFRMADANLAPELIVNAVEITDGVMPSANAAAASALLRLGRLLHETRFTDAAEKTFAALGPRIAAYPTSAPRMVSLMAVAASEPVTIFIAGSSSAPDTARMLSTARRHAGPDAEIVVVAPPEVRALLSRHLPAVEHMVTVSGKATAYVCIGTNCMAPENRPEKVADLLTRNAPGR